jgi:hypothetical protein
MEVARDMFSGANRTMRSADSTYNCMGLVFGGRRLWIEPENFKAIADGDGYRDVAEAAATIGDVVAYRRTDQTVVHVGFVIAKKGNFEQGTWEITVLSQWGADGEWIHALRDVPEGLGTLNPTFLTERVEL